MRVQKNKVADRTNWLAPITILLLAILAYLPAMHAGFIWDDTLLIGDNAALKSANGLHTIWITQLMGDNWPVTATSFWLEWRLWGMNASGYHVINIILHGLNAVLLWQVLRRLNIKGAWAAGLLFAVHPVCTASVAWISERKNTLSLFFMLVSFLFYLRADSRLKWLFISLVAFALALLSKSSVVGFPVILLLCAWWQNQKIARQDIIRTLPFFALSLGMAWLTIFAQHRAMNQRAIDLGDPLLTRLLGGTWAIWFYLGKILWPQNLTMIYPRWVINSNAFITWLPVIFLIVLILACWKCRKTWGRAGLCVITYFLIALAPVLGLINMAYFNISRVSDHLQYLAVPGILAFLAATGAYLLAKFGERIQAAVTIVVTLILASLTWHRSTTFIMPETLWADNIQKNPGAWRVHNSLGAEFFRNGKTEQAMHEYREALRIAPEAGDAHYNLGNALYRLGQREQAVAEFTTAAQLGSETFNANNNAGIALTELNRWDEAVAHYQAAIQEKESFTEAHRNLAVAYLHLQKYDAAQKEFETVLQYDPANTSAHDGLAAVLETKGNTADALALFQKSVQQNPENSGGYHNIGIILVKQGNLTEAVAQFQKSLAINPNDSSTHADLADAFVRLGQIPEAKAQFEEALKLNPANATTHNSYGTLLDRAGDLTGAMNQFEESIKLNPTNATAHKNLGLMFGRKQKFPEAIQQFQEALQLKPDADTESELGNVLGRSDRTDEALTHFQNAVQLDPNNANAHNGLGVVMDIKGRTDEAFSHFQTAVRLKPGLIRAHVNLANVLLKKGRREEAIAEYQTALKLQPGNAEAQAQLQKLLAPH